MCFFHQSSRSACAYASGQFEQDLCNDNNKKKHARPFCLPLDLHVTFFFLKHMHSVCTNNGMSKKRNKQINERKDE